MAFQHGLLSPLALCNFDRQVLQPTVVPPIPLIRLVGSVFSIRLVGSVGSVSVDSVFEALNHMPH